MKKNPRVLSTSTAAFLTYNTVGSGSLENGWNSPVRANGRRALVLQGLMPFDRFEAYSPDLLTPNGYSQAVGMTIEALYNQLFNQSGSFDHIVVYVGDRGSESAIRLAAKFPQEKVTFVMCFCNSGNKKAALERAGFTDPRITFSECSGRKTMESLFESFIASGTIPSRVAMR